MEWFILKIIVDRLGRYLLVHYVYNRKEIDFQTIHFINFFTNVLITDIYYEKWHFSEILMILIFSKSTIRLTSLGNINNNKAVIIIVRKCCFSLPVLSLNQLFIIFIYLMVVWFFPSIYVYFPFFFSSHICIFTLFFNNDCFLIRKSA